MPDDVAQQRHLGNGSARSAAAARAAEHLPSPGDGPGARRLRSTTPGRSSCRRARLPGDGGPRAGRPHPLAAAAGTVTTTPADTGTGSTRTRSVRSPAGSFRCCPRRLPGPAARLLLRRQRRHRLAAVSWHSSGLVPAPSRDSFVSSPEGAMTTCVLRAATGPLVPERAAAEHPCRRAVCAERRRRRRKSAGGHPGAAEPGDLLSMRLSRRQACGDPHGGQRIPCPGVPVAEPRDPG
jgi:hypothetical protein